MNNTDLSPIPKVAAAGVAGAATILLVFVVQSVFDVEIPAEVASAITTVFAFAGGYLKTDPARSNQ